MKIVFVISRYPWPIDKGDKLRAYYQIKMLSKQHEIFLLALNRKKITNHQELKKYCKFIKVIQIPLVISILNLLRSIFLKIPFQSSFFYSKAIEHELHSALAEIKPDLVFFQLIRMAEYARKIENIPKVIDLVDVLSKGLQRRKNLCNPLFKPLFFLEEKKVFRYESEMNNIFDKAIIITEEDKNYLPANIKLKTEVIKNGVDSEYYTPIKNTIVYDIMFSGNMNYAPNVDSAIILARKILPRLKKQVEDISLILVGSNPSLKVKQLSNRNIKVLGWVDDLREYYSRSKLFVAPLRIGTGLQNKILEAMSMGLPCVISSLCARSFDGLTTKEAKVCDSIDEYVETITLLLNSDEERKSMSYHSRKYVVENYDWNKVGEKLSDLLCSVKRS